MSYLGKISALVTVNTGDVAPKLNATAKSVQSFAKTVERDIGSSMRSAAKSLESIYTPLQKLERSLRAASSMKLSFGGFPGAIKDLDALKQRLTSLNQRQINVVLKATGAKSISAFREALSGLSSKEFNFIARVGGVEKLKELRAAVAAGGGEFSVTARLGDANAKVESLRRRLDEAKVAGSSVSVVVDASRVSAARSELERATAALRTFAGGMSSIEGITPSALSGEIGGRLLEAENKLSRIRGRKGAKPADVAAAEEERDSAASAAAQLATLRAKESAARRSLREAERGEQVGGPREQRRIQRDLRGAEKERREALAEAQRVYRDVVGVDLTPKDIEKLTRGSNTALDDLLSRATRSQAAMLKAGGSGDFVDVVRNRVMPALGRSDLNANAEKERQRALAEAAITKPLAGVKDRLMAAGRDIEAAYLPALSRTQAAAQALNDTIEKSGGAAADVRGIAVAFGDVERQIRRDTAAVQQFAEATAAIGALKTGKELVFASPELKDTLGRGTEIGRNAAGLPASVLAANPGIADSLSKVYGLSEKASAAFARLRALQNADMPTDKAQERLDGLIAKLRVAQDETVKLVNAGMAADPQAIADKEVLSLTKRAQAEREFYDESRRLREQAEADAIAAAQKEALPLTRRAQAEREFEVENRRLREQVKADLAPASSMLVIDEETTRREDLANMYLEPAPPPASARYQEDVSEYQRRSSTLDSTLQKAQGYLASVRSERDTFAGVAESAQQASQKVASLEGRLKQAQAVLNNTATPTILANASKPLSSTTEELIARIKSQAVAGEGNLGELGPDWEQRILSSVGDSRARKLEAIARVNFGGDLGPAVGGALNGRGVGEDRRLVDLERQFDDTQIGKAISRVVQLQRQLEAAKKAASISPTVDSSQIDGLTRRVERAQARVDRLREKRETILPPQPPGPPPPGEMNQRGRRTELPDGYLQQNLDRQFRQQLGGDVEDPRRRLGLMAGGIVSLKSQLDQLPMPLMTKFIPAMQEVEAEYKRLYALAAAGKLSPQDVEAASEKLRRYTADIRRAEAASKLDLRFNAEGLTASLDDKRLRGFTAQLELLETVLSRLSGKGLAVGKAAFNRYFEAVSAAEKAGKLADPATVKRLEVIRNEVAGNIASQPDSRTSAGGLRRQLTRVGDVGRMGADKASLALNQAAFAIDDFMSSTGGIEFKLRAISNNITQLAFVLGGTTGLFIGLGAVMASTVAISVMKWVNGGRTAEDQTKALNESLSRQKSLVEDLAQAFRSLGDSISGGAFGASGAKAAEFDEQIRDLSKKQAEARKERMVALDPGVQRERAEQNRIQRELQSETDPSRRVVLQAQLRQSQVREGFMAEAAVNQRVPRIDELREIVGRSAMRENRELAMRRMPSPLTEEQQRAMEEQALGDGSDLRATREALRDRLSRLERSPVGQTSSIEESRLEIQRALDAIDNQLVRALDELSIQIISSSRGAAIGIERAQEDVADAIRRGVPGAAAFQAALDNTAKQLREAEQQLADAQKIEGDPERRTQEVRRAQDRINDVRNREAAITEEARNVRLGRTFGGERTTSALSSLQGNERFASQYAGLTARLAAAVDAEVAARNELEKAVASGTDEEKSAAMAALEAAQRIGDLAAAAAEAAIALEAAVSRVRKIATDALNESERLANDAQQRFTENPTDANRQERDRQEQQLIADRERVARANSAIDRRRDEAAASDPAIAMIDDQLADIRDRREQLAEDARINGVEVDPAEAERLANEEARLNAEREQRMQSLTAAERANADAISQEIAARRRLVEAANEQYRAEIERGRRRDEEAFGFGQQNAALDAGMNAARQNAENARAAFAANPTVDNRWRRGVAEERLRKDEERRQELQDDMDAAERRFNDRADIRQARTDIERRDKERADIIATAKRENRPLTGQEQSRIDAIDEANREDRARVTIERDVATAPQRAANEDFAWQQEQRARADRGRDLGLSERDRFRKEMEEGVGADIRARAGQLQAQGIDPTAYMNQAIAEQAKQVAPMFEEFNMERQNALLQGPSRAALQVSDVTTTQGQAELNRLIRGDDAAKDVNLAELRKQNDKLDILIDTVKNNPLPVVT